MDRCWSNHCCRSHISGENIIVGANSVVTKDITESNVVVAGNPATIIKRLQGLSVSILR